MKELKNIKNILYIHGYNSSGSTGRILNELFKKYYGDEVNVYSPKIPANYFDARKVIDDFLKSNEIDLIIGTSLGGFMTLDTPGYFRISVNPTLMPFETLPVINTKPEEYLSYEIAEIDLPHKVDTEDKVEVYGLFGGKDKLVDFKDEFSMIWNHNNMYFAPDMEHQMKENDMIKYLFPIVEKIDNAKKEYSDYMINKNNIEDD